LTVAHPPGFPLYVAIQYLFTHLFGVQTVFWRAAFLTALCSLGTLAGLAGLSRNLFYFFSCVLPLAFAGAYFQYSVLPDVFMLSTFIFVVFLWVYFKLANSPRRGWILCLIFAAGLATHPIMLFAAPFLIDGLIIDKFRLNRSFRNALAPMVVLMGIVFLAYASLLFFHPASLYSWGNLQNLKDVILHALRADYGAFQLSGREETNSVIHRELAFFSDLFISIPFAVFFALVPAFLAVKSQLSVAKKGDVSFHRYWVGLFTFFFYLGVFLPLANVASDEILKRFFLFPFVLVIALASEGAGRLAPHLRRPLLLAIGIIGLIFSSESYLLHHEENNFSSKTIVEDYAKNLLVTASRSKPTVIIVDGDTRCHALRYLQNVENIHPETLVLCLGTIFDERQIAKIEAHFTNFHIDPAYQTEAAGGRDVLRHIVDPNLANYDFVFTGGISPQDYHLTFMALGQRISQGKGESLDSESLSLIALHSHPPATPSLNYDETKALYAEYADYDLAAAILATSSADAREHLQQALRTVPYCLPAQKNLCGLLKMEKQETTECERRFSEMMATEYNYYR
jgi:hypothetical protein